MSTNRAFISKVRSSIKIQGADVRLTDRAILDTGRDIRNKFIEQKLRKRIGWASSNLFTPLLIHMEEVPAIEFCDWQSSCTLSRSVYKLPKFSEGLFGAGTQGAFSVDGKRKFTEVNSSRYENILKLGLPNKNIYYWFFNGYLWSSNSIIEALILPAVVEGDVPKEFSMDCEISSGDCPANPLDDEFRTMGGSMESDVVTATVQYYMQTYKKSGEDIVSNSLDESK